MKLYEALWQFAPIADRKRKKQKNVGDAGSASGEARSTHLWPTLLSAMCYSRLTTSIIYLFLSCFYPVSINILFLSFSREEPKKKKNLLSSQDSFYHSFTFQSHAEAFSSTTSYLYFLKTKEEEEKPTWVLESKDAAWRIQKISATISASLRPGWKKTAGMDFAKSNQNRYVCVWRWY